MSRTMSRTVRHTRNAVIVIVIVVLSTTVASVAVDTTPPAAHAASGFTGLVPARFWDTRSGTGIATVDGTNVGTGRLDAGATYRLRVAGRGGVPPTGATAVVANVTAINPSEASFLTVHPAGTTRPNASNLNTDAGRTLPNAVIVPLSPAGDIDVYNAAGSTDVAIDVLGWFDGSGGFTGLTPARLWESRRGAGLATVDGLALGTGPLGPNATFRLRVTGRGQVPATGVGAVALNVTAIAPTAASFVTVFPAGGARPNASNLNTAPGRTLPNMVIVPVPASGEIDIYNAAGTTDMAVDVLGWFPSSPDALQPLNPARLWDTRSGPGIATTDGQQLGTGRLRANTAFTVQVTGRGNVPSSGVTAVALNVTAIAPDTGSFITTYPTGQNRPTASNLNTAPGRTLPNMVIVPVSPDGKVDVFNFTGTTDVAVDVLGWFPGTPAAGPANTAPTVANAIPDQTATAGTAFSFGFATNAFADADAGDSLTYTAARANGSALPSWLTFNAATRTFSGTPTAGDIGTLVVRVTATDRSSASAFDEFNVTVGAAAAAGRGWTLTAANTGLAGVGLTCAELPLYTGPNKPATNTTISRVRITWEEFDLSNGNITLDRVCIQPTTAGGRMSMVFGYNPDFHDGQLGPITIQDSDFDASLITGTSNYANCAFRGAANLYRNRMFGMGSGICYFGSPAMTSSVIEGNYVHGLRSGFYGVPPQQSHNESATVRSFVGTSVLWRNNRLESLSGADSGAMFIQTTGNIQNVTLVGNLFHTSAWNLALEAKDGYTYSNMQAIDNRFLVPPGGFGAAYVDGGPGWAAWSENYRYNPAATDGKGVPVGRP